MTFPCNLQLVLHHESIIFVGNTCTTINYIECWSCFFLSFFKDVGEGGEGEGAGDWSLFVLGVDKVRWLNVY